MTERRKGPRPQVTIRPRKQVCFRLDDDSQEFLEAEALRLSSIPPFHDISMSDLLRFAVREYRERHEGESERQRAKLSPPRRPCDVVDSLLGTYCATCSARGPVGAAPKCPRSDE